jgi:hypothetical protein
MFGYHADYLSAPQPGNSGYCAGARFLLEVAEECPDFDGELRVVLEQEPVRRGGRGFRFV